MRPVVVAMVQRLDQNHPAMQPEALVLIPRFVRLLRSDPRRDLDQLVAASDRMLSQSRDARELVIPLVDLRLAAAKPLDVPLLRSQQVQERRRKSPVGSWGGNLQLLVREAAAHIEKMHVRPLVVSEGLDQ